MIIDKIYKFIDNAISLLSKDYEQERLEFLRNTGFRDNDKSQIYEDDIIEHIDGEYSFTGIVQYSPFGWYVTSDGDNIPFEHFADDTNWIADCKVIGHSNVFTNLPKRKATKYRNKPVVVEAIRYEKSHVWKALDFCDELKYNPNDNEYYIQTLDGEIKVSDGDYIVKGPKGAFCPCKEDVFLNTFEVLE